jgi:hypothetical protein
MKRSSESFAISRRSPTARRWEWLHNWARDEDDTFKLRTIVRYLQGAALPESELPRLEELSAILARRQKE